jgi:hypothetical protein
MKWMRKIQGVVWGRQLGELALSLVEGSSRAQRGASYSDIYLPRC